jgi:hypothetical protein
MFSSILQALIALPKIFEFLKSVFEAVQSIRDKQRLEEAKDANDKGNTSQLEESLGHTKPGSPSGIDGVIVRPKKKD